MAATKKATTKKNTSNDKNDDNASFLLEQLQKHFGFDGFKGPQQEVITSILNGKDTFVIMPTGGEKVFAINCLP